MNTATDATSGEFKLLPLDLLIESPLNPRTQFDDHALAELAESIKTKGVLEPIIARPVNAGVQYEIVAGNRRVAAARLAELADIPAVVRALSDQDALEISIIENLQRQDIHPLDEAHGYKRLVQLARLKPPQIATRVGKQADYVYKRIQLTKLVEPAQNAFRAGDLETAHASIIAALPKDEQPDVAAWVVERQPTVTELRVYLAGREDPPDDAGTDDGEDDGAAEASAQKPQRRAPAKLSVAAVDGFTKAVMALSPLAKKSELRLPLGDLRAAISIVLTGKPSKKHAPATSGGMPPRARAAAKKYRRFIAAKKAAKKKK